MSEVKYVKDSQVEMTELILPSDANPLGFLLGGRLMHWIDIGGAIVKKYSKFSQKGV